MSNVFIQEIIINKVRHIENFKIPLSATNKKHLIITGKNGSGKTSLLFARWIIRDNQILKQIFGNFLE